MKTKNYKTKISIDSPAAEVYRAFTHMTLLGDWLSDTSHIEARLGGAIYLRWKSGYYVLGNYTTLEPNKKIAFTWNGKDEPAPTKVQITLNEKEGRTAVTLTHSGVGSGPKWQTLIKEIEHSWSESLENLKSVLESGIDLRVARLPRLGIFTNDFNAVIAKNLNVPTKTGLRIEGTVENTGARDCGLQKDDVIVKFAGMAMKDLSSLTKALQGKHAGDEVVVVFYRGAEKKNVMLKLSARPMIELPATPAELLEITQKTAIKVNADLDSLLQGVSETQAEVNPAPEEWNIKELVAHIICTERDLQSWLADMLNDNQHVSDSFEYRPNANPRLYALVKRCGTLQNLRNELKLAQQETLDYLSQLPESFYKRQHFYRRLAVWIMDIIPNHVSAEHGEQIVKTLEAAKK